MSPFFRSDLLSISAGKRDVECPIGRPSYITARDRMLTDARKSAVVIACSPRTSRGITARSTEFRPAPEGQLYIRINKFRTDRLMHHIQHQADVTSVTPVCFVSSTVINIDSSEHHQQGS
jgi:hypothetical protein